MFFIRCITPALLATQHIVFTLFLCSVVTGCWLKTGAKDNFEDNSPQLLNFIPWSDLSPASQRESGERSKPLAAATLRSQVPKTTEPPTNQVVSVDSEGGVFASATNTTTSSKLAVLQPIPSLVAFGEQYAIVAWSNASDIYVQLLGESTQRWSLTRLKGRPTSLAFHERDTALLIGGADGRIYRWRFFMENENLSPSQREKTLERYVGHHTIISKVLGIPHARVFLSADWDGRLLAWLPYTADSHGGYYDRNLFGGRFFGDIGTSMVAPRQQDRGITAVSISRNEKRFAVGTEEGFVEVWEIRGFVMSARFKAHNGRVLGVSLSDDGSRVASLGRDKSVWIAEIEKDPLYKIAPSATISKLTPVLSKEAPDAHTVFLEDPAKLIVVSNTGNIETHELPPPTKEAEPSKAESSQTFATDSDY